ncbi:Variant-specific surface protein [Giardia duodenalis assemblage B]|uniref:Variant-specific surface protein n=1 Tax=Giardia duodenalis assemblage B TaxID=1394984 RepID=A0A132NNR2_GIAIN|nr:Variant-specific surface protein [Giardia intestinalis assemblage B]
MSGKLLLIGLALQLAWAVLHGADGGASHRSRMQCGDKVGATVEGRTYAGVSDCAECIPDGSATAVTCTRCAEGLYLKTDGGATSCVAAEDCGSGSFPVTNSNGEKICVQCNDTAKGGIANCAERSPLTSASRSSTVFIKCTACSIDRLSPLGDACLANCPYGSYEGAPNTCTPCPPLCAECNSNANQDSCTACYPRYVLSRATDSPIGKCIPECTEEFGANCETCTANIVGSKYCSKCKSGYVPVDGVCVSTAIRTIEGCDPSAGVCTACPGNDYVLLSSGCYNTQTFPGSSVCLAATGGKCTDCTNGLTISDNSGICPSCSEGCSLCPSGPETCLACFSGYYKSGTKCFKCTNSNANGNPAVAGIPNCVSCIILPGSSFLTCYVKIDRGDDTKKSAFSTGTIAGISVAAVVVVGGLVGFLCWWFLCKTKRGGVSSSTTALTRPTSS